MDDRQIIELIKADPSQGIALATQAYYPLVKSIVCKIIGYQNQHDIEDCISEIYIKLWQSIDKLDCEKGTLKGYLAIIARNTAITFYRAIHKNKPFLPLEETTLGIDINMDEEYIKQANARILNEVLSEMNEPDKTIFILRYFYYEKIADIATKLNLDNKQVENKLTRGRNRLKTILLERGIIRT